MLASHNNSAARNSVVVLFVMFARIRVCEQDGDADDDGDGNYWFWPTASGAALAVANFYPLRSERLIYSQQASGNIYNRKDNEL